MNIGNWILVIAVLGVPPLPGPLGEQLHLLLPIQHQLQQESQMHLQQHPHKPWLKPHVQALLQPPLIELHQLQLLEPLRLHE